MKVILEIAPPPPFVVVVRAGCEEKEERMPIFTVEVEENVHMHCICDLSNQFCWKKNVLFFGF